MIRALFSDIRKHPITNIAVVVFSFISCFLISLGFSSFSELFTRIDRSMEQGKVPHFLQMHSGELSVSEIGQFADECNGLLSWQVQGYLNLDNSAFLVDGKPFITSSDDNGLSVQGSCMDYMLSLDGDVLHPEKGEIYVSDFYMDKVSEGSTIELYGHEFTVMGFMKDAQMGSSLSSSKRFLVSQEDYDNLLAHGKQEYLIEFRGQDPSCAQALSQAYSASGLPSNGPAVTWNLIKLMNALGEGMMIALIIISGLLAMGISLAALRFIILITMERDSKRLALMNCIGYSKRDLKYTYLLKYLALSFLGVLISFAFQAGWLSFLVHLAILLVLVFSHFMVLGNIVRLETVSLLREEQRSGNSRKTFALVSVLMAFVYMLSFIPNSVSSTLSDKDFVTSMGIGKAHVRIDAKTADPMAILDCLAKMEEVTDYALYQTYKANVTGNENLSSLLVEVGEHNSFPVSYSKGRAPEKENEIAVSTLTGLKIGDLLTLNGHGYEVVGVYGDITNGGITSKATSVQSQTPMWSIIYLNSSDITKTVNTLSEAFPEAKTKPISEYVKDLYGKTIAEIGKASRIALGASALIVFTLVLLMLSLTVERSRRAIVVKKAIGYGNREIRSDLARKLLFSAIAGLGAGIVVSYLVSPLILSLFLGKLGAGKIAFSASPVFSIIVLPVLLLGVCALAFPLGTSNVNRIRAIEIKGGEF